MPTSLVWILLAAVLAVGGWLLRDAAIWSLLPACPFHALTGWYCAGCGSTRLLHALLQGHLLHALRANPLAFVSLPGIVVDLALFASASTAPRVFGGLLSARLLLILIVGYTVLRNIPVLPFLWLAPA